ncbi:MAG: hypothetical protein J7M14_03340, partial [Planctomycetes bacterium]|nr:hypothetical protein [Planctomycetota bacterium]
NKYYYKCGFFGPRSNRGSSFWLLDEPIDYDDYAANRFFLSLARHGVEQADTPQVPVEYRTDVSTPSMVRALWNDNVCTLWNSSGMRRYGVTSRMRAKWIDNNFWCYGNGPAITTGPVAILHRLLWSWSLGTAGDMPYWNFGSKDWNQGKDLHVIYSGDKYAGGSRSYLGGIAGVRLKTLRRCQQDFEYLNLLAQCKGWDRHRVRSALAARSNDPKAPVLQYTRLTSSDWADLREAVVATILAGK